MNMECRKVQELLSDLWGGKLSGEESRSIRIHLSSCPTCFSRLSPEDRIEILTAWDAACEPSEDIGLRFRARLELHRQENRPSRPVRLPDIGSWLLWRRDFASIGLCCAVLILGIYLGMYRVAAPGGSEPQAEVPMADQLQLLKDMGVIKNLEILEDFDDIEALTADNSSSSSP
jgi:hypothetical protein